MDRVPLFTGTDGPHSGQRYPITADGLVLGRDPTCAIHLEGAGISREHARVFLYNASVWVQDSGSRNGVFVNDKRLTRPKSISPGDVVRMGEHRFTLELAEPHEMTSAPLPPKPGAFSSSPTLDGSVDAADLLAEPSQTDPPARAPTSPLLIGGVLVAVLGIIGLVLALS